MKRIRGFKNIYETPINGEVYTFDAAANSWGPPSPFSTHYSRIHSDYMEDEVIADFKKLKAEGKIFNNAMLREKLIVTSSPSSRIFYNSVTGKPVNKYTGQTYLLSGPILPNDWDTRMSAAVNTASAQAYAGVDAEIASGLVTAGEMRETIAMFKSLANAGWMFLHGFPPRISSLRELNSWYLGFRYGIMPLASDIANYLEALKDLKGDYRVRQTSRGFSHFVREFESPDVINSNWTIVRNIRVEAMVRAYIIYDRPLREAIARFNAAIGLRLSDVIDAAYDLTPYSFVLDMFTNAGNFIASYQPKPGVTTLASGYTVQENWSWSTTDRLSGAFPPTVNTGCTGNYIRKYRVPGLPRPNLSVRPDVFDDEWADDIMRLGNSLALLVARLPRAHSPRFSRRPGVRG